jgi:hypothetical protein
VLLVVSITFLRSPVLAIFAMVVLLILIWRAHCGGTRGVPGFAGFHLSGIHPSCAGILQKNAGTRFDNFTRRR